MDEPPALVLASNGIPHGRRDTSPDAQPCEPILADALDIAKTPQAFLAGKAAVARASDAAKGQLNGVVGCKVVDGHHAGLEAANDGLHGGVSFLAMDRSAQAEVGCVGDGQNMLC